MHISSTIEIACSREQVWSVLADFEHYPLWNPFIRRAQATSGDGGRWRAYVEPHGVSGIHVRGSVLQLTPPREMRLRARFVSPALLVVEHTVSLEVVSGVVVVEQHEDLRGLLATVFRRRLRAALERSLERMNLALKVVAECQAGRDPLGSSVPPAASRAADLY